MKSRVLFGFVLLVLIALGMSMIFSKSLCDNFQFYECVEFDKFPEFYAKNLRASIFAGFLTLGGFLMSLKTFIIVNMKKELYDSKSYGEKIKTFKANSLNVDRYGPLKALSDVIFFTIVSCICTSIFQLTVGLLDNKYAAIFCMLSVSCSIMFLIWTLYLIRSNLKDMFDHLDEK